VDCGLLQLSQLTQKIMPFKYTSTNKVFTRLLAITWPIFIGCAFAETDRDWESTFTGTETFWGAETNNIKVALLIDPLVSSNNVPIHCTPVIKSSRNQTNYLWLYFPPLASCYQMTLQDRKGNLVAKTTKGKSLGKPIAEPLMVKIGGLNVQAGYKLRLLAKNRSEVLSDFSFNLRDYFEVTNSGKYRLSYKMQIVLPQKGKGNLFYTTNFQALTLLPVEADVEIIK
jgi:hypothetical protein